jgi:hypothetical protein
MISQNASKRILTLEGHRTLNLKTWQYEIF